MASIMGATDRVDAANYATYPTQPIGVSLLVELGGDANAESDESLELSLSISGFGVTTSTLTEDMDLSLLVASGPEFHTSRWFIESLGLSLDLGVGVPYNLMWTWDPFDQPKLTGKNYTYECYIGIQGTPSEGLDIVIRFEGSYVTEKTSNATGEFVFWAVVGSPGMHTWSFTIYDEGVEEAIIYKDTEYVEGGPGPDPEPDPTPPPIPPLPTEPGSLFGVFDYLPVMVVFGLFGFIGNLLIGRVGVLFGAVAALFLTAAMGTLPTWLLYFVILVTILVVVFKLKSGGSSVTVAGPGGGEA